MWEFGGAVVVQWDRDSGVAQRGFGLGWTLEVFGGDKVLENAACLLRSLLLKLVHFLRLGKQCFVVMHVRLLYLHLACPLGVDGGFGAEYFL